MKLTLDVLNANGQTKTHPLIDNATVKPVPGAWTLLVQVRDEDSILHRREVDLEEFDQLLVCATSDGVELDTGSWFLLPAETPAYLPERPFRTKSDAERWDLVVLIDATATQVQESGEPGRLLPLEADVEGALAWDRVRTQLEEICKTLAKDRQLRVAIQTWADLPSDLAPEQLKPRFLLEPSSPRLSAYDPDVVRAQLGRCRNSTGGDLVDAVADALLQLPKLPWAPSARRMALLVGNSPGFSLLHPLPKQVHGNGQVRTTDVDMALLALNQAEIELLTYYVEDDGLYNQREPGRTVAEHTRQQYVRLASCRTYSVRSSESVAEKLCEAVSRPPGLLGRGLCLPLLES